jgi:hypothetical protein
LRIFPARSAPPPRKTLYHAGMRRTARLPRPQRSSLAVRRKRPDIRRTPRARAVARPVFRTRPPVITRTVPLQTFAIPDTGFQTDPYLDYARRLTPEGGILIIYKDLDVRLRQIIFRILAWAAFTGFESWLIMSASPVESLWINAACLLTVAGINFLILWRLPELHRSIEIRPDCMIIEGSDVFWLSRMEAGWPALQQDEKGNHVLSGIYGTRFVEYLTVRRFDDYDRTPDVLAAHLQEAMMQLWAPPAGSGTGYSGAPGWQG